METKQIDVRCPACRAQLAVDVRTARVVRWSDEKETDPLGRPKVTEKDWEAAFGRVRSREERVAGLFESALESERDRERGLEDRFASLAARTSGTDEAHSDGPLPAFGSRLARAIRALDAGAGYVVDRTTALAARGERVRTVCEGRHTDPAAVLLRGGFEPERTVGVWARSVGERVRVEATPTEVRNDGSGLAVAPDLDDRASPAAEQGRLEGALISAERAEARVLAVRVASFSLHEGWLRELGFALSHLEQIWIRRGA